MLTLQESFTYDDSEPPPIDQVDVTIGFPQYEAIDTTEGQLVTLATTGQGSLSFKQTVANPHYFVSIPTADLFGPSYGSLIVHYVQSITQSKGRINLGDVSVPLSASFGGGNSSAIDVLYFFQGVQYTKPRSAAPPASPGTTHTTSTTLPAISQPPHASDAIHDAVSGETNNLASPSTPPQPSPAANFHMFPTSIFHPFIPSPEGASPLMVVERPTVDRLNGVVDSKIFFVNKSVYLTYLGQLFPTVPPENDSVLLYLLSSLVDLTEQSPRLAQGQDAAALKAFNATLTQFDLPQNDAAYATIVRNFAQFFNFPLKMPKVQLLSIAGTLQINSETPVTKMQFSYYRYVIFLIKKMFFIGHRL